MGRDFSKVAPQFWTGKTGKAIRERGPSTQVVALYLLTNPSANMIGLYHLPVAYLLNDTGCTVDQANKAIFDLWELGFAYYDSESEFVFIPNMAKFQVGEELEEKDKRVRYIIKELKHFRKSIFFKRNHKIYKLY